MTRGWSVGHSVKGNHGNLVLRGMILFTTTMKPLWLWVLFQTMNLTNFTTGAWGDSP